MSRFSEPEEVRLPAIAAIATVAAISAAPAAVTPASATTATVAATPTTTAAAVPAAPTTAGALGLRPGFVDHEVSPAEILTVHGINRAVSVFVVVDFDEGEAARLSGETIANEIDTRGSNTDLGEPLVELIFRGRKRKIPDVELLHLPTPSARNLFNSRGARRRDEHRTRAVRVAQPPRARDRRFSGPLDGLENKRHLQWERLWNCLVLGHCRAKNHFC
jgi:hypothetical protein